MIKVQLFSGPAGLRALAPTWRSLTAKLAVRRHFHHVEWHLALAETFEQYNLPRLQCFAVFSADNALAAVFPFRVVRVQLGPTQLNALRLASDHADAQTARDFILAPGLAQTTFFQGFVKYMAAHDPSWDVIELPGILEDSAAAVALKQAAQVPFLLTAGGAWGRIEFVTCGENDQPFNRLSKSFKQNMRTAHNKLKTRHVTFQIARSQDDLKTLLPDFLNIESSGWKGQLGTSALKQPETVSFLRGLISYFGANGCCEIHLMKVDHRPIAALFGILTDNIWYLFRTGYDESYHQLSPGHLIIENLLRKTTDGSRFDVFTPYNAPPWFQAWKPNGTLKIFNAYVFRPSPAGLELANRTAAHFRAQAGRDRC